MDHAISSKTIVFSDKPGVRIPEILDDCVRALEELYPEISQKSVLLNRIKWTATELIINGLKHAGSPSKIIISLHGSHLHVEKTDTGKPFSMPLNNGKERLYWPLPDNLTTTDFFIYSDPGSQLYSSISKNGMARFWHTEHEEGFDDVASLYAHFGLLIIAKSADEFSYYYKDNSINIFTCKFNIS